MTEDSSHAADVLIIGGGIIGCSIAWRLAQAGLRVTVLDRIEPGAEASSAAAGMLAPLGEMVEPAAFSALCVASRGLYPRFASEIEECSGHGVGYRSDGSLLVALDAKLEVELEEVHDRQTAQGFDLQPLTAGEVHARSAGLSPQIRCGLFVPGDHWVDNERLMRALVIACQRAGVRFEAGHAVHKFQTQGGHITRVVAGKQSTFTAKTYVLAAGCWSGEIAGELGFDLPMTPCRGQMMEFEAPVDLPFVVRAGMHYLVPRSERRVLVGTTAEYHGFEKSVTAKGLHSILEGATRLSSMLSEWRFLRAWAGFRPDTADHLPILGYGEMENLIFATGHFRNGILLAPITAEIVADLILKGSTLQAIESYRPTRFKESGDGMTMRQR
ncbi:MAG: glycine oxidase ThiO [Terriglobia bacterium]